MGNFSRDTFNPLKQYVSVRLQQGVPLVDADWNEMDDIRRFELRTFLKWFVGDGVPANNDGFHILAERSPNNEDNFKIKAGICLVDGFEVIITADMSFNAQRLHTSQGNSAQELAQIMGGNVPVPLISMPEPPTRISGFNQVVYLDVWEWEVGEIQEQKLFPKQNYPNLPRLVNQAIGIETCVRIRQEWAVRVRNGTREPQRDDPDYQANHSYYALAIITRRRDEPTILSTDIVDIRRKDLSVANMKVPIFAQQGTTVVDSQKFADLLEGLRSIYRDRLERKLLFLDAAPSEYDKSIVDFAIQYIAQIGSTGALQAKTDNLTNADALQVLATLHDAQQDFLAELEQHGNPNDDQKDTLITEYRDRLKKVNQALQAQSFLDTYLAQREINLWFAIGRNIEAAEFLGRNEPSLTKRAFQQLVQENPTIIQPGGPVGNDRLQAACLRDLSAFLLQPVIEACEQNSFQPLDTVLNGARETLLALGQPISLFVRCLQILKELMEQEPDLSTEAKSEAAAVFDYMISGLS